MGNVVGPHPPSGKIPNFLFIFLLNPSLILRFAKKSVSSMKSSLISEKYHVNVNMVNREIYKRSSIPFLQRKLNENLKVEKKQLNSLFVSVTLTLSLRKLKYIITTGKWIFEWGFKRKRPKSWHNGSENSENQKKDGIWPKLRKIPLSCDYFEGL